MTKDVNITIGGSLNALQWAYQHGTRLIINKPSFPPPYEPSDKKLVWGLLYYKLMMDGKIIGGDYVNAVRIDDDEITVACKNNIINRTTYDNVTLFDDENVIGLPDQKQEVDQFTVIDTMMAVSFVFKDTAFTLKTGDDLVNEIHIHKDYINSPAKIAVVSNLNKKQLNDFDFSDTMAKFKTETILKDAGFTGNFMKRDEVVLEVQERIVKPKMNIYEEAEKIKFIYV
tara:strand:- start:604 stop:1287 length:684 start_codon:yes stop_codon:yes gene_type:complete